MPPIATALQSRDDIQSGKFTAGNPPRYPFPSGYFDKKPDWPIAAVNMDMDGVLSTVLAAIESFLSPEYAIRVVTAAPSTSVDECSALLNACIGHKQTLAKALTDRVVQLTPGSTDAYAATTKYNEACLLDLRNYYAVDAAG